MVASLIAVTTDPLKHRLIFETLRRRSFDQGRKQALIKVESAHRSLTVVESFSCGAGSLCDFHFTRVRILEYCGLQIWLQR
jgi:hypothetical protein